MPQVKAYAQKHKLTLVEGWKVEVARLAKTRIPQNVLSDASWTGAVAHWQALFEKMIGASAGP